jgi:hypothetical protein
MIDEKLQKYAKALNVLYVNEAPFVDKKAYEACFKSLYVCGFDEFVQKVKEFEVDIVFVEFSQKDIKSLFSALMQTSAKKVLFTPFDTNATFLKNALKAKVDTVMQKPKEDKETAQLFENLVKSIYLQYKEKSEGKKYQSIVNANLHCFIYLLSGHIQFICEKTKTVFGIEAADEFEKRYLGQLGEVVKNPQKQHYLQLPSKQNVPLFLAESQTNGDETVVSLTPLQNGGISNNGALSVNRLKFIEELKNVIVHQDAKQACAVNIAMVKIINNQAIKEEFGSYNALSFSSEFVGFIKNFLDTQALVATWTDEGFVLMSELESYQRLKQKLQELNEALHVKVFENAIVPFVKSALIQIKSNDLNEIIALSDGFFAKGVSLELAKKYDYFESSQITEDMDEKEKVFSYFSNIMYAQTPLKLLNIYKGVNITTTATVEKIESGKLFIKAKNIQLYTMQIEKKTVVQSSSLPKDVEVNVEFVDLKRNLAVFANPTLLEFSANNRETTRVQSDFRFPIKMRQNKMIHSGEILDLSIRSVAIKFPAAVKTQFKPGDAEVTFRMPIETLDEGFYQTKITGNLIRFDELKDHRFVKAIILLSLEEPDEGYVLEYIYKRQREIIFEIKKLALKGLANGF